MVYLSFIAGFRITDLRALLMAVETLHRGIDVEDPRQTQNGADAGKDVPAQPLQSARLIQAFERRAHHILTDDAVHAQQTSIDRVAAHRVDVSVAPVTAEDAQERGADDVELALPRLPE